MGTGERCCAWLVLNTHFISTRITEKSDGDLAAQQRIAV